MDKVSTLFAGRRIAQCWYSAGDYEQIKAVMQDGNKLPGRYEEWLAGAKQREDQVRGHGGYPVRVAFNLDEFRRYCAHFSVPLDTKARSQFAATKSQMDADGTASSGTSH